MLTAAVSRAEFVQLVASQAAEVSDKDKKSTVQPEHVVTSLQVRRRCCCHRVMRTSRVTSATLHRSWALVPTLAR